MGINIHFITFTTVIKTRKDVSTIIINKITSTDYTAFY